jgi:hypothetical protein
VLFSDKVLSLGKGLSPSKEKEENDEEGIEITSHTRRTTKCDKTKSNTST